MFGDRSAEFENALLDLDTITTRALATSLNSGKGRMQLDKFDSEPTLVLLRDGDDRLAHDVITGKRIAMLGAPIEPHSARHCQCVYCEKIIDNGPVTQDVFEVVFFANEPPGVARSATLSLIHI